MAGIEPKCYQCGKPLAHTPGTNTPGLCSCEEKVPGTTREPELHVVEGSEIVASVDASGIDLDSICRPIFINQECECLNLTIADARRLLNFLNEAVPYIEARKYEH